MSAEKKDEEILSPWRELNHAKKLNPRKKTTIVVIDNENPINSERFRLSALGGIASAQENNGIVLEGIDLS